MSTYYSYFLGFMVDGELQYAGPYDRFGKPLELATLSGGWTGLSEMNENFNRVTKFDETIGENFNWDYSFFSNSQKEVKVYSIPLKELNSMGAKGGVRKGFIPVSNIDYLEQHSDAEPDYVIEEVLSPFGYAVLPPEEQKNYSYYMWKQWDCVDNFADIITTVANNLIEGIVYNNSENKFKIQDAVIFYPSPY